MGRWTRVPTMRSPVGHMTVSKLAFPAIVLHVVYQRAVLSSTLLWYVPNQRGALEVGFTYDLMNYKSLRCILRFRVLNIQIP